MKKKYQPLNGTISLDSNARPSRQEVIGLLEKCDGYILAVKMGSGLSIRSDGLSGEEAIATAAQIADRVMYDVRT